MHNQLGHRFQRRLNVPVWLESRGGDYSDKVLNTQSDNVIAYWPLWEPSGANADNLEGTAARDGTYTGVTLGQIGIGDGNPTPSFDGVGDVVDIFSASFRDALNPDQGTWGIWARVEASEWTDGVRRQSQLRSSNFENVLWIAKDSVNNQWWFRRCGADTCVDIRVASGAPTDYVFLAMTWDVSADELKGYVDGVQVGGTQSGLLAMDTAITVAVLGAESLGGGNDWIGGLGHSFFSTAVYTQPELLNLANV